MTDAEQDAIVMRAAEAGYFAEAARTRYEGAVWDDVFAVVNRLATALTGQPYDLDRRDYDDEFRWKFWRAVVL